MVEVKSSLGGDVTAALEAFGLGSDADRREVLFLEDTTVGVELPLFQHGVVLRVRHGEGADDSTVKLRPCRRSQLAARWQGETEGDGWKFRAEEDWAATRRSLAASFVVELPGRRIRAVREGEEPLSRLFRREQEAFLDECADVRVWLDGLTLLAPVAATRWENVRVGDIDDVTAERWTVDGGALDFLELSLRRSDPADAEAAQRSLDHHVAEAGLRREDERTSKTEQVLAYLVERGP